MLTIRGVHTKHVRKEERKGENKEKNRDLSEEIIFCLKWPSRMISYRSNKHILRRDVSKIV